MLESLASRIVRVLMRDKPKSDTDAWAEAELTRLRIAEEFWIWLKSQPLTPGPDGDILVSAYDIADSLGIDFDIEDI